MMSGLKEKSNTKTQWQKENTEHEEKILRWVYQILKKVGIKIMTVHGTIRRTPDETVQFQAVA